MRKSMILMPLFGAFALAGCGGNAPEEQAETPAVQPAAEEVTPAEAPAVASAEDVAEAHDGPPASFSQCKTCHAVEPGKNGVGPSLAGVFGREAAQAEGFTYSTAMKESGVTWDEATLDAYLKAPQQVVPGTKMSFAGVRDDTKRAEVIDYLETLK